MGLLSIIEGCSNLELGFKNHIGYVWAILSSVCFVVARFFVKIIDLPSSEIAYFRSLYFIFFSYILMKQLDYQFYYPKPEINRMLIVRGFLGALGLISTYYGVKSLPLGEWSVIHQTTPIITAVLAPIILNEKFEKLQMIAILFSMIGIILIAKPPFLPLSEDVEEANKNKDIVTHLMGILFSFGGAFFTALVQILIKKLGGSANSLVIIFEFGRIGILVYIPFCLYEGFQMITMKDFVNLFCIGVCALFGQILKNRSYLFGKAVRISIMGYSQIILNFLLDVYYFDQIPDLYSIIGTILIVSSLLSLILKNE